MGNSASAPSDFKAVARRHFPFKGDVALGQTSVVVPIWNGKGNIFTVIDVTLQGRNKESYVAFVLGSKDAPL